MCEGVEKVSLGAAPSGEDGFELQSSGDNLFGDTNKDDEFEDDDLAERDDWLTLGYATDRITADYIIESLKSYEIEATTISKGGYLGDIGLTGIASPFSGGSAAYQILVPADRFEEAAEIAEMVAGEKWEPADPTDPE